MNQNVLVLIKPDAMKRELAGNILSRLSETKVPLVAVKLVKVTEALAQEHYKQLKNEPYFTTITKFLAGEFHQCDAILAMVYSGPDAITKIRALAGATNPEQAEWTTIRKAYGRVSTKGLLENVMHASSDPSEAEREIKLWFKPEDITVPLYPTKSTNKEVLEWA